MAPTPAEIAHWVEAEVWRTDSLLHALDAHAAAHGDRLAVADQSRRLTYRELADRSAALAAWLVGLGLPAGSVVAVQSPSNAHIPLLHFACNRADLTFLPLSDAWREREIGHLLARSEARVVVLPQDREDVSYTAMVAGLRGDLPRLEVLASFGPGTDVDLDEVMLRPERHPGTGLTSQTLPRMCMVTSGTSGFPKISLYSDDNLWFFLSAYWQTLGVRGTEVFAGIAPANTGSTGYIFPVLAPLLFGSTAVLLEHWNPVAALELMAEEGVGVGVAVPTQLIKMLDVATRRGVRLPALRVLSNAGAPMPPEVAAEIDATLECAVLPMYGATDGGVPTMTTVDDPPEKRHRSVGRPLPHTDLRIGDGAGPGEVGEVRWRNPIKSYGYLADDAQTAAAFTAEGLYRSGDLGRVDEEGYLHIVGRAKDLIIRGGQNISPREIEDVVVELPAVLEAAVLGLPDPVYGERVCLCVVPTAAAPALDEVEAHLRARGLAGFMVPEEYEVFEEFPTNSGGKVSKADLRSLVLARRADRAEEAVR